MTRTLSIEAFIDETCAWASSIDQGNRKLLAIAGAPGSGKSTLAERLVEEIEGQVRGTAAVLPMDGFHFDDEVLALRGWRDRKGAPHTFDVDGFAALLERIVRNEPTEIAVPRFDRELEIARGGARLITRETRLIVVEGNYLLLNRPPWSDLHEVFDRSVFLKVPLGELTRRLTERWTGYGLSGPELAKKLDQNDLVNARTVVEESILAEITVLPG